MQFKAILITLALTAYTADAVKWSSMFKNPLKGNTPEKLTEPNTPAANKPKKVSFADTTMQTSVSGSSPNNADKVSKPGPFPEDPKPQLGGYHFVHTDSSMYPTLRQAPNEYMAQLQSGRLSKTPSSPGSAAPSAPKTPPHHGYFVMG